MTEQIKTDVLVLGAGPGGYSGAFRAADLGQRVVIVEKHANLGGVCLNVGCIPSKALLHVAQIQTEAKHGETVGLRYGEPEIDLDKIRAYKDGIVSKLSQNIGLLARSRNVKVVKGVGQFVSATELQVEDGPLINFEHAIVAAGSRPVKLPFLPDDPRIWDSTAALELREVPPRLLVIGGGIIGLEMATVYQSLGSNVTVVEAAENLIPAADKDLLAVYTRYNKHNFTIMTATKVEEVMASEYLDVQFATADKKFQAEYDAILVAVGRSPNGAQLGLENAGVNVDAWGFVQVDEHFRTNIPTIFAIGDVIGNPMLAHKASYEAHVAAEVIAGHKTVFRPKVIPSIAYTNPEIAWAGLTEKEVVQQGIPFKTAVFPWTASGRAQASGRSEGKTKLIYHAENGTLLGAGIVGINAGELLGEICLGLEFCADIADFALTVHAHPTLYETIGLAGELAVGSITDLPNVNSGVLKG